MVITYTTWYQIRLLFKLDVNGVIQRKLPEEIEIIRYANRIGSQAHVEVMRAARPGAMEYQLESTFLSYCYR